MVSLMNYDSIVEVRFTFWQMILRLSLITRWRSGRIQTLWGAWRRWKAIERAWDKELAVRTYDIRNDVFVWRYKDKQWDSLTLRKMIDEEFPISDFYGVQVVPVRLL